MGMPMNATPSGNGIFSRYLQWLLSQLGGQTAPQGAGPIVNPDVLAQLGPILNVPAGATEPGMPSARSDAGVDAGSWAAALRNAQRTAPGSFAGTDIYAGLQPAVDPNTMMQEPSGISRNETLDLLRQQLMLGNYQFEDMSKDYIDSLAKKWDDFNTMLDGTGLPFQALDDTVSPIYGVTKINGRVVPVEPGDTEADLMAGLFNLIVDGASVDALLEKDDVRALNLSTQKVDDLKKFASEEATRQEATRKINFEKAKFASNNNLPDPMLGWDISPDVYGSIWQRQKTGLTDAQAAQQEMDVAMARWEASRGGYKPQPRDQVRADVMDKYYKDLETQAKSNWRAQEVLDKKNQMAAEAAQGAATSEIKSGLSADAAERVGERARTESRRTVTSEDSLRFDRREKDAARIQKELDAEIDKQVRLQGTRAMMGERSGGNIDLYAEYQRAKRNYDNAKTREAKDAAAYEMEVIRRFGSGPFENALLTAKKIQTGASKNY